MKQFAIIGLDFFGKQVSRTLELGAEVLVIDRDTRLSTPTRTATYRVRCSMYSTPTAQAHSPGHHRRGGYRLGQQNRGLHSYHQLLPQVGDSKHRGQGRNRSPCRDTRDSRGHPHRLSQPRSSQTHCTPALVHNPPLLATGRGSLVISEVAYRRIFSQKTILEVDIRKNTASTSLSVKNGEHGRVCSHDLTYRFARRHSLFSGTEIRLRVFRQLDRAKTPTN